MHISCVTLGAIHALQNADDGDGRESDGDDEEKSNS
jgi:hypothetical protein